MTLTSFQRSLQRWLALLGVVLTPTLIGCGAGGGSSTGTPSAPQPYFAPSIASTNNGGNFLLQPNLYALDEVANPNTFTQSIFGLPRGSQIINAGTMTKLPRGLFSLTTTANYVATGGGVYTPVTTNLPKGGYAIELSGQTSVLIQVPAQPPAPAVQALNCPNFSTAQTYLFVTLPGGQLNATTQGTHNPYWDPAINTAYGTVDISTSGANIALNNIHQFTLPSVGGSGAPVNPSAASKTGVCGPTVLGNTISVPGQNVTTDPGFNPTVTPQATIAIGPSGLLAEDNGLIGAGLPGQGQFENALGDGTGAVGLPKPTSAVDVSALRSAQYLGFIENVGYYTSSGSIAATGWSSHVASFGFPSVPAACSGIAPNTSTVLYGGDFQQDNPSQSSDGFGNCDFAIDFGAQDSATNGLFPHATVSVGGLYAANTKATLYSFQAVAIAGQLNGKFAIFLLGTDNTQPWLIELFQSN